MATKNKRTETEVNVTDFINSYVENEQKKVDSFRLIELMKQWSGFEPKMWGATIIGFGSYHISMQVDMKEIALLLVFHPVKRNFHFMYSHQHKTTNICWTTWEN